MDLGILCQKAGDQVWQDRLQKAGWGHQPKMANTEAGDVTRQRLNALNIVERPLDLLMQQQPIRREEQPPSVPVEEFEADIALKLGQKPACGRLTETMLAGGRSYGSQVHDRAEDSQGSQPDRMLGVLPDGGHHLAVAGGPDGKHDARRSVWTGMQSADRDDRLARLPGRSTRSRIDVEMREIA